MRAWYIEEEIRKIEAEKAAKRRIAEEEAE